MNKPKGSILLLVLWTLSLLSVFAVSLGFSVQQRLVLLERLETRNKLCLIAQAGVKKAMAYIAEIDKEAQPMALKDGWANSRQSFADIHLGDGEFTVSYSYKPGDFCVDSQAGNEVKTMFGMEDEERKININTSSREVLVRLLMKAADLDETAAGIIASCIIDWRDEDNQSQIDGAEGEYYRSLRYSYECKDALFEAPEELLLVKNIDNNVFEKIKPYITVYGSSKQVNINTAARTVLFAVGVKEDMINKIMKFRCGTDGLPGTADDNIFTEASTIAAELSQNMELTPEELAGLSNLVSEGVFTTRSNIFSINCTAIISDRKNKCRINCVMKKNMEVEFARPGWILSWRINYFI